MELSYVYNVIEMLNDSETDVFSNVSICLDVGVCVFSDFRFRI